MIYEGSRYEHTDIVRVVGADGVARLTVMERVDVVGDVFRYSNYTVVNGDRPDTLAERFFGDPELWWVIADHNPQLLWFGSLAPGWVLRIPEAARGPR